LVLAIACASPQDDGSRLQSAHGFLPNLGSQAFGVELTSRIKVPANGSPFRRRQGP
jgi:hypothetical protein